MQNKLTNNLFGSITLALTTKYIYTNNAWELFWVINLFFQVIDYNELLE